MGAPGRWVGLALLCMGAAYGRVLTGPPVYEDAMSLRAVDTVTGQTLRGWLSTGRALTRVSFDATYLIAGFSPVAYHTVNVVLHGVNGALVYRVGAALVGAPAAAVAASLFLLHPIQTESVSYMTGRSELLAACFTLLALWCALGPLTRWRGIGCLLCAVLAMASKETAAAVVVLAPLMVWARRGDRQWYALLALLPVVGLLHAQEALVGNTYVFAHPAGGFGYLAYQCAALWRMIGLVVWPVGFTIDHDVLAWSRPVAVLGLAGVVAWLTLALVTLRRSRTVALCLLWPLIVVAPRGFIRIVEYLNEHQTLMPFIGLWWLIGMVTVQTASRVPGMRTLRPVSA